MRESDAILLGCVGKKLDHAAPAKDLYTSPQWQWRLAYALATAKARGTPWFIASAKHGLLEPDEVIEPYDLSLRDLSPWKRRSWAARVAADLEGKLGSLRDLAVELHAGGLYKTHLPPELCARGAAVRLLHHEGPSRGVESTRRWYENAARGDERWIVEPPKALPPRILTPAEWQLQKRGLR